MALDLSDYKAAALPLSYFEEICKIPHPSSHTERIADYLVNFAKAHGLSYVRDAHDNVLIRKEATPTMRDHAPICFQGHTDMVAECEAGYEIDMTTTPISLYRDGDFLRAKGTTLGADDGVAVAYALAVLASDDIPHPDFEALFTSDEEIGLIGASKLDVGELKAKYLVNIDSDGEGVFTVGCAGGVRCDIEREVSYTPKKATGITVTLSGGMGGHSGVEIDRGRANAVKLLAKILCHARAYTAVEIAAAEGGNADNAIPSECTATVCVGDSTVFERAARECFDAVREEYANTDPALTLTFTHGVCVEQVLGCEDADVLLGMLCELPSGVVAMSSDIPGLVETSLNVGSIRLGDTLHAVVSVRSSKESEKDALCRRLRAIAEDAGASFSMRGDYPAWEYQGRSHLIDVCESVYKKMYDKDAQTIIIHAGLECGILSTRYKGLSCLSLGPDSFEIHTPRERLSLSSFVRVWEFLKEVLKTI